MTGYTTADQILCYTDETAVLQVTVELKNDLSITGVLHSVDQYLNVKLNSVKVVNETKYPHMVSSAIRHRA